MVNLQKSKALSKKRSPFFTRVRPDSDRDRALTQKQKKRKTRSSGKTAESCSNFAAMQCHLAKWCVGQYLFQAPYFKTCCLTTEWLSFACNQTLTYGNSMLPFHTGFDHVTGHQLQSGLKVFAKLLLWPVEVFDEGLQSIQLPEEILRCPWAITTGPQVRG